MDEDKGDGGFISWSNFERYIKSQEKLCASYRQTQTTKIEGLQDYFDEKFNGFKTSLFFVGAIISILTLINIYMNYIGAW